MGCWDGERSLKISQRGLDVSIACYCVVIDADLGYVGKVGYGVVREHDVLCR